MPTNGPEAGDNSENSLDGIDGASEYSWDCPLCENAVGADTIDGVTGYAESHLSQQHDMTLEEYRERWPDV